MSCRDIGICKRLWIVAAALVWLFSIRIRSEATQAPEECATTILHGSVGVILSPGFPHLPHKNGIRCLYVITVKPETYIQIIFTDFNLPGRPQEQELSNFVKIIDGPEDHPFETRLYGGKRKTPFTFISSTNQVTLLLETKEPMKGGGVLATYHQVDESGCIDLEENIDNIDVSCTRGHLFSSECSLRCAHGYAYETKQHFDHLVPKYNVVCRKTAEEKFLWKAVSSTPERSADAVLPGIAAGISVDNVNIRCERIECDDLPLNVDVISCTRNPKTRSKCSLQCKDGYLPAPHLYQTEGLPPERVRIRKLLPRFSAVCKQKAKRHIWQSKISDRSNPSQLLCLNRRLVGRVCLGFDFHVSGFGDTEHLDCPYHTEQLFGFFDEKVENASTTLPNTQPRSNGTNRLRPYRHLNLSSKEVNQIIQNLRYFMWDKECMEEIRKNLTQNGLEKDSVSNDVGKVNRLTAVLVKEMGKDCGSYSVVESNTRPHGGEIYMLNGGFDICTRFCGMKCFRLSSIRQIIPCLRCKFRRLCRLLDAR